jgi:hypothetical protein
MTHDEAEEICLDIMLEYFPKSLGKASKRQVIGEILSELSAQGVLRLEDEADDEEVTEDDSEEDLVDLMQL